MLRKILFMLLIVLAVPALAQTVVPGTQSGNTIPFVTYTWEGLAKNTAGSPAAAGNWRGVKTVQIDVATIGEQNVTIQGSMSATGPWFTLHAIELDSGEYFAITGVTADALYTIIEDVLYVRPLISNEVGVTVVDVDVILGAYNRN